MRAAHLCPHPWAVRAHRRRARDALRHCSEFAGRVGSPALIVAMAQCPTSIRRRFKACLALDATSPPAGVQSCYVTGKGLRRHDEDGRLLNTTSIPHRERRRWLCPMRPSAMTLAKSSLARTPCRRRHDTMHTVTPLFHPRPIKAGRLPIHPTLARLGPPPPNPQHPLRNPNAARLEPRPPPHYAHLPNTLPGTSHRGPNLLIPTPRRRHT